MNAQEGLCHGSTVFITLATRFIMVAVLIVQSDPAKTGRPRLLLDYRPRLGLSRLPELDDLGNALKKSFKLSAISDQQPEGAVSFITSLTADGLTLTATVTNNFPLALGRVYGVNAWLSLSALARLRCRVPFVDCRRSVLGCARH